MNIVFKHFIELSNIVVLFFLVVIILAIIFYIITRKFKATDKEIRLYGIFLGMRNIDIIILSFMLIQTIAIFYCSIVKKVDIQLLAIMLAITYFLIIIYNIKGIITEILSLSAEVIAIYFNKMLYQYRIGVEDSLLIKSIQIILTIFIILYSIYMFLAHLEVIVKKNENVRRNKTSEG